VSDGFFTITPLAPDYERMPEVVFRHRGDNFSSKPHRSTALVFTDFTNAVGQKGAIGLSSGPRSRNATTDRLVNDAPNLRCNGR